MLKRTNKITALLVVATSMMSIVPAMASERLGTKDGTIENAIAFKDGKYIYQGYRTDDDNNSVYYNAGDKDKELDDLTDASLVAKFDTNSAIADDGDEYLVDMSTGKVSDEDLASDVKSTASDKLESKLKKTDRYGDYARVDSLTQVAANQFGEVWYQYQATTSGSATTVATANGNTYYGYTDKTGKYIDADKTANLRVFDGTKIVKIDEFDNDFTNGIKADLDTTVAPVTIAQDKDYLYRIVTVNFTTQAGVAVKDVDGNVITSTKYLQKISKAQGDKEKDAYLPKTVESYEISSAVSDDTTTALNKLATAAGNGTEGKTFVGLRVIDGTIYYTEMDDSDTIKTYKLKLQKNEKVDAVTGVNTTTKVDAYVVKKDGDKDHDLKGNAGIKGASFDIDGTLWIVNQGKISKSVKGGDFEDVYTCDRSLDSLDVYDSKSLVAWDSAGDVYTTVQEGTAVTDSETAATTPATPAKIGWDKLADGTWNFYDATGAKIANNWVNVGGAWYFLKADGVMATGWVNQGGTWYYLASSGDMKTGWLNDNGTWYYLNASGAMLANTTVDGYVLGASGAWIK